MTNQATFESIKQSLIQDLKSSQTFKDFNYEASNINAITNLLSKNTLFNIYYIKMLFNEISSSTATNIDSLNGYSSRIGHLIKKNISAKASLKLTIPNSATVQYVLVPSGTKFTTKNSLGQTLTFTTLSDYTLTDRNNDGLLTGDVIVHEGVIKTHTFQSQSTKTYYTIKDSNVDVNTIKVFVKKTPTSTFESEYQPFKDVLPEKNDLVYYLKYSGLYYSLFFGGDSFGYQPKDNEVITVKFLSTVGDLGNGAYQFTLVTSNDTDVNNINHYPTTDVVSNGQSSGGRSQIEIDELRKMLTTFNLTKVVAVTPTDYKNIIVDNFGDISSISVWGGEDNEIKKYGTWFVSIKPKSGDRLSEVSKLTIKEYLQKNHGVVNDNVIFVDPVFVDIRLNIQVTRSVLGRQVDKNQLKSTIITKTSDYNNLMLGKFDSVFTYSDYTDYILQDIKQHVLKFYTRIDISNTLKLNGLNKTYTFNFNNPITSFITNTFKYGSNDAYFTLLNDGSDIQNIKMYANNTLVNANFGTVDITNGKVSLYVPDNVLTDTIELKVSMLSNDVDSANNRIIRISNVEVDIR